MSTALRISAAVLLTLLAGAVAADKDHDRKLMTLGDVVINFTGLGLGIGQNIIVPDAAAGVPAEVGAEFVTLNNAPVDPYAKPARDPDPLPTLRVADTTDNLVVVSQADFLSGLPQVKISDFRTTFLNLVPGITLPWIPYGLIFTGVNESWSDWQTISVKVNQAPVDVLFMADTTGSMYSAIQAVKTAAFAMFNTLNMTLPNLQVGIAGYKDFGDIYTYKRFAPISAMTAASFSTLVNANWAASGGGDWPEAQLYGLTQASLGVGLFDSGWRASAIKIIVWFGDAPAHDPSGGATLASTKAALLSKGIKVVALDGANLNYPYPTAVASDITSTTGGLYYNNVNQYNIAANMISGIANINVNIKPVVQCPLNAPFIIEVDPTLVVATPLQPGCFHVRVKACDSKECAPPGRYVCNITFIDTSNGNIIDMKPIVIVTAPGYDTTPPWFTYTPPSPLTFECPNYYRCPLLQLNDNCDLPRLVYAVTTYETPMNSCHQTMNCTWAGQDSAGNVATPVTQTITVVDTTPPKMSSLCAAGAICLNELSPMPYCFSMSNLIRRCFSETCNGPIKYAFACGGCIDAAGAAFMSCDQQGDRFCIRFDPLPAGPKCCWITITVSDTCGNSFAYMLKVCFVPKGTSSPYDCLASSLLSAFIDTTTSTTATLNPSFWAVWEGREETAATSYVR